MKFLVLMLLTLGATPVAAQSTASLPLAPICMGVLDQSNVEIAGDHTRLCACVARETPKRMTPSEIMVVAQAALQGTAPPNTTLSKVLFVAAQCLQENP